MTKAPMKGLPSGPLTLPVIVAADASEASDTVAARDARILPVKRMSPSNRRAGFAARAAWLKSQPFALPDPRLRAPALSRIGGRGRGPRPSSIQRFELDDNGAVLASGPERNGVGAVVDKDTTGVGVARHGVFDDRAGLRVDSRHAVTAHAGGPDLAIAVHHGVVGRGPGRGERKLLDALARRVEQADLAG